MKIIVKSLLVLMALLTAGGSHAQLDLKLQVLSSLDSMPVAGASINSKDGKLLRTDNKGCVRFSAKDIGSTVMIRHMAFQPLDYRLLSKTDQKTYLIPKEGAIETVDVISTGYFSAPKDRLAGSYVHIDNKLLNRSASGNLLDRLEGVSNGLQFDRGNLTGENTSGAPDLRIRGSSTLLSDNKPLIVVDDFPFDGDLRSINPNDVESVTILRDASAASIWGAKAGNGVIVINMKRGAFDKPVEITANTAWLIQEKPDLFYNRATLNPVTVMDFQKQLFEKKGYTETNVSVLPAYVELLIKKRDKLITEEEFVRQEEVYRNSDIRRDAEQYIYRNGLQQLHNIGLRGGESRFRYNMTAGYQQGLSNIEGQKNSSYNLSLQNALSVGKRFEIEGIIRTQQRKDVSSNVALSLLGNENIYMPLMDSEGNSLSIVRSMQSLRYGYQEKAIAAGLLDWMYRPIDELYNNRFTSWNKNTSLVGNIRYSTLFGLQLKGSYTYTAVVADGESYYNEDSYFARNLINTYTQADGSRIIPLGGVWKKEAQLISGTHALRLQSNYSRSWIDKIDIDALAGLEASSQQSRNAVPFTYYGYNELTESGTSQHMFGREEYYVRPEGYQAMVPTENGLPNRINNRLLSAYGNVGLSFLKRYILSGSIRWDGSNLLGVKTNARGIALWSIGSSWDMKNEPFFDVDIFSQLKWRATYGSSGNINKSLGHLPVMNKREDTRYQLSYAILNSPGNPSLRWEQVNMLNLGVDWGMRAFGLTGSVEWFDKQSKYLLSSMAIDPTIGVSSNYMQNYADMRTRGVDFSLGHHLSFSGISIQQHFLLNYASSKVNKIKSDPLKTVNDYMVSRYFIKDESPDVMYSIPWPALDGQTGLPLFYARDGSKVSNYQSYYEGLKIDDLSRSGVKVAPWFGSYRLGIGWKGIEASTLLIYKFGHVGRMKSYGPGAEQTRTGYNFYHMDYYDRWQKPGDEAHTYIPATTEKYDINLIRLYQYGDVHIVPLDHLKLQDLTVSYSFNNMLLNRSGIKEIQLVFSANNLGILWKRTRRHIDPEYPNTNYPMTRQFNMALRINI